MFCTVKYTSVTFQSMSPSQQMLCFWLFHLNITECPTFLMSSRKATLSPLNVTPCGPVRLRLASTLSSFREDRHLAKTASPEKQREGGGEAEEGDYLSAYKKRKLV